jgi:tellurite methyltransferase
MEPFWEETYRDFDTSTFGDQPSSDILMLAKRLRQGSTVLDIGCGEGRNSLYLASIGCDVDAFDISPYGISKLKHIATSNHIKINAWVQDLITYEFDKLYDLIICYGVLHLIDKKESLKVINNIKQHTKTDGFNSIFAFTNYIPMEGDNYPFVKSLFDEGELKLPYLDWNVISYNSTLFKDQHPGGIMHIHSADCLIAMPAPSSCMNEENKELIQHMCLEAVNNAHILILEEKQYNTQDETFETLKLSYAQLMNQLSDFCAINFIQTGQLTEDFIRGLHRLLFPAGFIQIVQLDNGDNAEMVPGEYKLFQNSTESFLEPGNRVAFLPPSLVSKAMELAVNKINCSLMDALDDDARLRAIFTFFHDFLRIHPFFDANFRTAAILADLLMIKEGLPLLNLTNYKKLDRSGLHRAMSLSDIKGTPEPLMAFVEMYKGYTGLIKSAGLPSRSIQEEGYLILDTFKSNDQEIQTLFKALKIFDFKSSKKHETAAWFACVLALKAVCSGNFGIGAAIINSQGDVLAYDHNRVMKPHFRSDQHAEMTVMTNFENKFPNRGKERLFMITSLEPCPMCYSRLLISMIPEVFYVADDYVGGIARNTSAMPMAWQELSKSRRFAKADCSDELYDISLDIYLYSRVKHSDHMC